jgi:hypothetical protein
MLGGKIVGDGDGQDAALQQEASGWAKPGCVRAFTDAPPDTLQRRLPDLTGIHNAAST